MVICYFVFAGIVVRKEKTKGTKKVMKHTRGMMKVEGLDLNDDEDAFGGPGAVKLRPSVSSRKSDAKKKGCKC